MSASKPVLIKPRPEPVSLDRLAAMPSSQALELYRTTFGRDAPAGQVRYARRKIAWRLQAEIEGGLPESALQHALAIARSAKLRIRVSDNLTRRGRGLSGDRTATTHLIDDHDSRLPMPGSVLIKKHRERTIVVRVLDCGFEYDDRRFRSLSAIAREITGTKWNGFLFFGLAGGRARAR